MIHYSCEGRIEKSVPWDHRLSSLGEPRGAKRRSSGQIFLFYPYTHDRFLYIFCLTIPYGQNLARYQTWCLCLKTRTVLTCTQCRRDQSTVYRWKAGDLCARITFMSRRISFHNFVLFSFITQSNKLFVLSNSDTCHSIKTSISYFIHLSTNKLCFMKRVFSTSFDWFMSSVCSYYSTVEFV